MMDLGGIINHAEQLIGGLKDLGHQVDFKEFVWKETVSSNNKSGDWKLGPSGVYHDQRVGWNFHKIDRITYRGAGNISKAVTLLCEYDMIIWETAVPSKSKENLGNSDWIYLYDLPSHIKQVVFIHDGNASRNYPHISVIDQYIHGYACVHPCALGTTNFLKKPRGMILNPQFKPVRPYADWDDKQPGFVNMQTFKAWKRVHELIEAIAYMPEKSDNELREVAGEGIEYRYMTSEDKCKEAYFHTTDRSDMEWFHGWKFWDAALGQGMTHHGVWNSDQVDQYLTKARVLVDPSWSDRYSMVGGHFNRVGVEAMMRGAVVVAREKGMGSEFFIPGENYFAIPTDADPQEYADLILRVGNLPKKAVQPMIEANRELLHLFDREFVARQVIDLAYGSLSDVSVSNDDRRHDVVDKRSEDVLFQHFGIL
jgi:glycosyltransferase involved in cell wall biosynthesis